MKYLQVIATLLCALLAVIVWQLHGMRPLRYSEIEEMTKDHPEQAWEKMKNAPIVTLGPSHSTLPVQIEK